MEQITLGEIAKAVAFLVALGGSIVAILVWVKKILKKLFDEQLKSIGERLDKVDTRLGKLDMDNCQNYIVQTLSAAERGESLTTEEKMRLAEEFEHYTKMGGNSYVKEWHERLKTGGKI